MPQDGSTSGISGDCPLATGPLFHTSRGHIRTLEPLQGHLPGPRLDKPPWSSSARTRFVHLPLWQPSTKLQRLYRLAFELEEAWCETGAEDAARLRDTEKIAAVAIAEIEGFLALWQRERSQLEERCSTLVVEVRAVMDSLADESFTAEVNKALALPVRERVSALESLKVQAKEQQKTADQLRMARARLLVVLGRRIADFEGSSAELEASVLKLREETRDRRMEVKSATEAVRSLWEELGTEPSCTVDTAIDAGMFGVSDAQHTKLLERVAYWQEELTKRRQAVADMHQKIQALAGAGLPEEQVGDASGFIEVHQHCKHFIACEAELQRLEVIADEQINQLEERLTAATISLGMSPAQCASKGVDKVDRLQGLSAELNNLEKKLHTRQQAAYDSANRARMIWEELGEDPGPGDAETMAFLGASVAQDSSKARITETDLAAIQASKATWEARRAGVLAEVGRIHAALHAYGEGADAVPDFVEEHSSLHFSDRLACKTKLQTLQTALWDQEEPTRAHLQRLYSESGADERQLADFLASLEAAETPQVWIVRLLEEEDRMVHYHQSISDIIGHLEELKNLAVEGARFEAVAQAGEGRFSGNSLHFLEEERFRKNFARRYPGLRNALVADITAWEAKAHRCFTYRGMNLREKLHELRDNPTKLPGGLSMVEKLLQLFNLRIMHVRPSPLKQRRGRDVDRSIHHRHAERDRSSDSVLVVETASSSIDLRGLHRSRSQAATPPTPLLMQRDVSNRASSSTPTLRRPHVSRTPSLGSSPSAPVLLPRLPLRVESASASSSRSSIRGFV